MRFADIYHLAVSMGMAADPRGLSEAEKDLSRTAEHFATLAEKEIISFDLQALYNPYSDSRMLLGEEEAEIKKVMVGIDIEGPEVLLADRLNAGGAGIDLLMSHHPQGRASAAISGVVAIHRGHLERFGLPAEDTAGMVKERQEEVRRKNFSHNHNRTLDLARILGFNFVCLHTVLDNLANDFIYKLIDKEKPRTLGELKDLLFTLPEYQISAANNAPPIIDAGTKENELGRVYVDYTGGASGPQGQYEKLMKQGVNTVLTMYADGDTVKLARELGLNLLLAGHISSDSLGINLFLDEIEKQGVEIVPVSGLIRVRRN